MEYFLAFVSVVFVYWATGRTKIEKYRSDNGNLVIIKSWRRPGHLRRSFSVELDYTDPQTQQNMSAELKRLNDWWESSKHCKH
jgi:hypothetical protein